MSRTTKTRPFHVRVMDPKDHAVGMTEHHNHEKGFCDLPQKDVKANVERVEEIHNGTYPYKSGETCRYDFVYTGTNICGCPLCTGQFERKHRVRKTRHTMKRDLGHETKKVQALMMEKGSLDDEDFEELDSPTIDGGKFDY